MDSSRDTEKNPMTDPHAVLLMKEYGISMRGIGRQLSLSSRTVLNAMDIEKQHKVAGATVRRIRKRVVRLLRAAGWQGDVKALWSEYEQAANDPNHDEAA